MEINRPQVHLSRRNIWILTGYGIIGLATLAVMAYAVSNYVAR